MRLLNAFNVLVLSCLGDLIGWNRSVNNYMRSGGQRQSKISTHLLINAYARHFEELERLEDHEDQQSSVQESNQSFKRAISKQHKTHFRNHWTAGKLAYN